MNGNAYPTSADAITIQVGDTQYEFFTTDDGSPTVRRSDPTQPPEAMHHCGGALTESLFIYGEAIRYAKTHKIPLRAISVGLGIGYNEIIAVALSEGQVQLLSFEKDNYLREGFVQWLVDGEVPTLLKKSLDKVLEQVATATQITSTQLKIWLQNTYNNGHWLIAADAQDLTPIAAPYHIVMYDAFSKKSSPELWGEEFLGVFLKYYITAPAVFATYAANGSGRRAIKNFGFELLARTGFQGKRESTFAILPLPKPQ